MIFRLIEAKTVDITTLDAPTLAKLIYDSKFYKEQGSPNLKDVFKQFIKVFFGGDKYVNKFINILNFIRQMITNSKEGFESNAYLNHLQQVKDVIKDGSQYPFELAEIVIDRLNAKDISNIEPLLLDSNFYNYGDVAYLVRVYDFLNDEDFNNFKYYNDSSPYNGKTLAELREIIFTPDDSSELAIKKSDGSFKSIADINKLLGNLKGKSRAKGRVTLKKFLVNNGLITETSKPTEVANAVINYISQDSVNGGKKYKQTIIDVIKSNIVDDDSDDSKLFTSKLLGAKLRDSAGESIVNDLYAALKSKSDDEGSKEIKGTQIFEYYYGEINQENLVNLIMTVATNAYGPDSNNLNIIRELIADGVSPEFLRNVIQPTYIATSDPRGQLELATKIYLDKTLASYYSAGRKKKKKRSRAK